MDAESLPHRLAFVVLHPDTPLPGASHQAGDCVAPRTIHEAVLEGRRVALAL